MKKTSLLIAILSISSVAFCQKIDDPEISFTYVRNPLTPLQKTIKNYQSFAVIPYEDAIIAKDKEAQEKYAKEKADYPKVVADAEAQFQADMKQYEADMEAWKKKSYGEKLLESQVLNENNKPVKPYYTKPQEPVLQLEWHQKVFSKNMLASTYLKLDGFANNAQHAAIITVKLLGFENTEPELINSPSSVYDVKLKATRTIYKYWYEMQYKHPIELKVEEPGKGIILDEILPQFNNYSKATTETTEGTYPPLDREAFVGNYQDKIVTENMKQISEYINDRFGYSPINRTITLYRVDPKKFTYDDYQQAFENTVSALNSLTSDYKSAVEKLKLSTDLWEKALTEYDPKVKKARIDEDIAIVTHFNLVEAYIWLNDFVKADLHLSKLLGLDPSNKQKKMIARLRELLVDQKKRLEAQSK